MSGTAGKNKNGPPPSAQIDRDLIRELAALLTETELSEIEIEQGGLRLRVARRFAVATVSHGASGHGVAAAPGASEATEAADPGNHPGAVISPMVGTAYSAPQPGAPPFVQVGDTVQEGQTLVIVEAMKTMNPIPSPKAGRVTRILVSNAQPVEYGEVLMIIE